MMNRKKSSAGRQARFLLLAPLSAGLCLLFAPAQAKEFVRPENAVRLITQADTVAPTEDEEEAVKKADVMPQYPGGEAALLRDVFQNVGYPASAIETNTQGTVVLRFVIKADGSIGKIKVMRSLSKECDQAAIDAVRKLKRFTPGKTNGRPVAVWYALPIRFKLAD